MSVNLLLILFVLVVVAMIAIILVQKGAGATAGSAFGSGASSTVFGAKGSGNFLTKTTMILAFLFFAISLFMAVQASKDFAPEDDKKVDLGVMGTLDTSDSDIPEVAPINSDADAESSDVPQVNVNTEEQDSDIPSVEAVDESTNTDMPEAGETSGDQ